MLFQFCYVSFFSLFFSASSKAAHVLSRCFALFCHCLVGVPPKISISSYFIAFQVGVSPRSLVRRAEAAQFFGGCRTADAIAGDHSQASLAQWPYLEKKNTF